MRPHLHLCLSVLTGSLLAQDPPSPPSPPPTELLRLECDGPATWRTRFAPTNFGAMLASQVGGDLWGPRLAEFEALLGRWFPGGKTNTDAEGARQRWLDFAGRIELVVCKPPADADQPARAQATVRLHGDGHSDLDAMATDLRTMWHAAAEVAWREDQIDDLGWQALPLLTWQVSAPHRSGDTAILCFGDASQFKAIERFAAALPAPRADAACLRLVVNASTAEPYLAGVDQALVRSWRAFGFAALREVEFRVGLVGPHVLFEVGARFEGDERGVFGALFPAAAKLPALLHLVPADGTPWKLGHFDWSAFVRASHASEDAYRGDRAGTARKAAAERAGGEDLETELLAHLHTDYLLLGFPGYSRTKGFDLKTCAVFRTRDDAKVAAGLAHVFAGEPRLFGELEVTAHDGIRITSYPDFLEPETLTFAVARGVCVVAVGDDGPKRVITVLDRAKAAATDQPPESWRPTLRHAPPGTNGISDVDLPQLLEWQLPSLLTAIAFLPVESTWLPVDEIDTISEQVLPLLERFELRRMRTITGYQDRRWVCRCLW